jgi:hypothetical protein
MSVQANIMPNAFSLDFLIRESEVVVLGTVEQVDPGRWNSPDGKRWSTAGEKGTPAIYRSFLVQPDRVLKGAPRFGTPVAFMVLGGTDGVVDGPVSVGDRVLVFGYYNQGIFGDVTWKKDAYWATLESYGIFRDEGAELANVENPSSPRIGKTTLAQVQTAIAAQMVGAESPTVGD